VVVCERVCGGNGEFTSDWDSLASFLSLAALVKTGNSPLSTQLHNCTTAILNSYIYIHTTVNYGCSSTIHNQDHVTEKDTKLCSMYNGLELCLHSWDSTTLTFSAALNAC